MTTEFNKLFETIQTPTVYWVMRHGGRRTDKWRIVARGSFEHCTDVFKFQYKGLRQGGVYLVSPEGSILESGWAPRLRTRW